MSSWNGAQGNRLTLRIEARTGLRSPYTLIKRANSLLAYLRWVDGQPLANLSFSGVFQETLVWEHFQYLKKENKPPTSGSTLLSAMRFLHYVLEVDVQVCISSRRIVGASQQLAAKTRWLKQARALTVDQVRKLHELLEGSDDPLLRCFAEYALIAVYGRCRHSDLQCIWDLECDFDGVSGFLQIRTGRHKTSTTAKKKAQFLHILVPAQGVVSRPWLPLAIQAFEAVNLCLSGKIDGPIFRHPLMLSALPSVLAPCLRKKCPGCFVKPSICLRIRACPHIPSRSLACPGHPRLARALAWTVILVLSWVGMLAINSRLRLCTVVISARPRRWPFLACYIRWLLGCSCQMLLYVLSGVSPVKLLLAQHRFCLS